MNKFKFVKIKLFQLFILTFVVCETFLVKIDLRDQRRMRRERFPNRERERHAHLVGVFFEKITSQIVFRFIPFIIVSLKKNLNFFLKCPSSKYNFRSLDNLGNPYHESPYYFEHH